MKTVTVSAAINRLEKMADNKQVSRNSGAYKIARRFIEEKGKTIIRTCHTSGSGRFIKNMDVTAEVLRVLQSVGCSVTWDNDSPRGGKTGNYLVMGNMRFR